MKEKIEVVDNSIRMRVGFQGVQEFNNIEKERIDQYLLPMMIKGKKLRILKNWNCWVNKSKLYEIGRA